MLQLHSCIFCEHLHTFIVIPSVLVTSILQQDFGKGLYPMGYDSKKLNRAECHYNAYDQEVLGIVWVVSK